MSNKTIESKETLDPEMAIESAISKTEKWIENNGKSLLTALAVIVVVVGSLFAYKYLYKLPQEKKAANMVFVAEQLFAVDSFALALNGDSSGGGFLNVIERFGSTSVANVANHYAGVCYIKLGNFDSALKYLRAYKQTSGVPNQIINAQNLGLQGDVLSEQKNYAEAAKMYRKASDIDNNFTSPYYLLKEGGIWVKLGDMAKAIEAYDAISNRYPTSMEARDIEKYKGAADQQ